MAKEKITKTHLILSYLAIFGTGTKEEILAWAAAFEGKPFKPTSNFGYFNDPSNSVIQKGFVYVDQDAKGRKYHYKLTDLGLQKLKDDNVYWLVQTMQGKV
jgi:hypothetical protein